VSQAPNYNGANKEFVILELQAIAQEFLSVAQTLPLSGFNPPANPVFPANPSISVVELAAAQLFNLHLYSDSSCTYQNANSDPSNCINHASTTGLFKQMNLQNQGALINSTSELVKILGLNLINSYLSAAQQPEWANYASQNANLLYDLHGSQAEYAINFGILASILSQDQRTTQANIVAVCKAGQSFNDPTSQQYNPTDAQSFSLMLTNAYNNHATTLCALLEQMDPRNTLGVSYGTLSVLPHLHPNMFLAGTSTGGC